MSAGASRSSDPERTFDGGSRYRLRDLFTLLGTLLDAAPELAMRAEADAAVMPIIGNSLAQGRSVLLQIMDSSKRGWRAPSAACLDEIARRWPRKVQVVVDACQARLGRRRLRAYRDRGHMVLMTGPSFFGSPAFSSALLESKGLSRSFDRIAHVVGKIELLLDRTAAVPASPSKV